MSVRPARPLSLTLATAVLAGGLGLTAAPASALEVDGVHHHALLGVNASTDTGTVQTMYGMTGEDLRVTVAAVTAIHGDVLPEFETGEEVEVEVSYEDDLEAGLFDITEARRSLGEDATGQVIFQAYLGGEISSSLVLDEDADLTDSDPGTVLSTVGPQDWDLSYAPILDRITVMSAPGSRMVYLTPGPDADGRSGAVTGKVVDGPEKGKLVAMPKKGETGSGWVYVADEGVTGEDEATFTLTAGDVTRTLVVTFSIGDERADDGYVPSMWTKPLPYTEAEVLARLAETAAPEIPAPSASPTAPASPSTPAAPTAPASSAPTTPAPASAAPTAPAPSEAEHTVPEKVQTGDGAAWWLAGLGTAAAAALVATRRRLGLTR